MVALGRYRLLRTIGRGGMGQVFEAWDTQLERHVAIKLVLRGGAQATLEEARCLARVAHPNVVCVHDVGCAEEIVYIAMELVDGPDLRRWLRDAPREWSERLGVLIAAGRGLAAVHDAGLLHGDVKPGNVLIGRDGRVRVADFGLARADAHVDDGAASSKPELDELVLRALAAVDEELVVEHESEPGLCDLELPLASALGCPGMDRFECEWWAGSHELSSELAMEELRALLEASSVRPEAACMHAGGTLPYMAPERRRGCVGGPAADQYSFCATAWEALFGVVPEPGGLAKGSASSMSRPMIRSIKWERPVEEVLRRGLAEQPEERWPSMDALCSALEQARDRVRWSSRRPRAIWAAALGFCVVAGTVASLYMEKDYDSVEQCEVEGRQVWSNWGPTQKAELEVRFATTPLSLPRSEGRFVIERLDGWVAEWSALWSRACEADSAVQGCLRDERDRFEAVLDLLDGKPDSAAYEPLAAARALVTELGSPTACLDPNRGPSLDADGIGRLAELSAVERRIELAVLAGAHERAADELRHFDATLDTLAPDSDPVELALRRLGVERLRARVLLGTGYAGLARKRLRAAIREAESYGDDGLRFALLLEQTRLTARLAAAGDEREAFGWVEPPLPSNDPALRELPTLDDLAALDGLAERVEAGPVARAELALIRAGLAIAGGQGADHRQLTAELAAVGEVLTSQHPDSYAELRLELALRRAQLHFAARELDSAVRAAEQARAIGKSSHEPAGLRVWAALALGGISSALLGDCERVGPILEDMWQLAEDSNLDVAARQQELRGLTESVDWEAVRQSCSDVGGDLNALVRP